MTKKNWNKKIFGHCAFTPDLMCAKNELNKSVTDSTTPTSIVHCFLICGNSVDNNITCSALLNLKFTEHFGNSVDSSITCSALLNLKCTEHFGNSVDNNITCPAWLNSKFIEHFGNSIDNNITCPALLNSKFTEHFGNSVYVPVCMFTLQGRKLTGFESGEG